MKNKKLKKLLLTFITSLGFVSLTGCDNPIKPIALRNDIIKKANDVEDVIDLSGIIYDENHITHDLNVRLNGDELSVSPKNDNQILIPANATYLMGIYIPMLNINSQEYVNTIYFNYTYDILPIINYSDSMIMSVYNYGVDGNVTGSNVSEVTSEPWSVGHGFGFEDVTISKTDIVYPYNYVCSYAFDNDYWYSYTNFGICLYIEVTNSRNSVFTKNVYQNVLTSFGISSNGNLMQNVEDSLQEKYNAGYFAGYDTGKELGYNQGVKVGENNVFQESYQGLTYQQIYTIAYNEGYNQRGTSKLPDLFGAIVNIPIQALNGLASLTYFDISIMRVVITILALSVVLYVISLVMSAKG